jgi:hypothetical protein
MSQLKLPAGADAGFRLELWDAFGNRFTANVYGAGRRGWFLAAHKWFGNTRSVGPQPLARGQWREFLGLVKQAGFWELPETLPADPDLVTDDGEWLSLAGRVGDRYHAVHRDGGGRGLLQVQRFLTRLSGFFPEPRPSHPTEGLALRAEPPDAEPGAAPDRGRTSASRDV